MSAALEVEVAQRLGEFELDVAFTVESGISVIVASGVPALLVTHDEHEAEELGDITIGYGRGYVSETRTLARPTEQRPALPPESEA